MCVLYVLHVRGGVVCRYAALCHHHCLPRTQVTHVSAAKHACTPSEGDAYNVIMAYMYTVKTRVV